MSFLKEITKNVHLEMASFEKLTINDINTLSGNSKKRIAFRQTREMRLLQDNLKTWLRKKVNLHHDFSLISATGSIKGSSPYVQAQKHRRKDKNGQYYFPRHFWSIDLKNAYQNVVLEKLVSIIVFLSKENVLDHGELLQFFKRYCFSPEGGLVVGASASPDLFNIYCESMIDRDIRKYCGARNISYTRYLDDLVFFSNDPIARDERSTVRKIVTEASFIINERKTVLRDLTKGTVSVNGVGVDIHGNIFTPRKFTASLKGLLHKVLVTKAVVPNGVINGNVQVFLQALSANSRMPNRTEQKVLKLCHQYLRQQEEIRRIAREEKNSRHVKSTTYWMRIRYENFQPF